MKQVLFNIINLTLVKFVRLIIPLAAIPILSSKLSTEYLSFYFLAMLISAWVSMILDFGFEYSGVRKVSSKSDSPVFLRNKFTGVLIAKLILASVIIFISLLIYYLFYSQGEKSLYIVIGVILGVSQSFIPVWFYLSLGKLNKVSLITISINLFILASAYFLSGDSDLKYIFFGVVLLRIFGAIYLSSPYTKKLEICRKKTYISGINYLVWGREMFVFQAVSSLYTAFPGYYFSIIGSSEGIIAFGVAERVMRACGSAISPISQSLYPLFCKLANTNNTQTKKIKNIFLLFQCSVTIFIISSVCFFSSDIVIYLLGNEDIYIQKLICALSAVVIITNISNIYGVQGLLAYKKDKVFNKIIISLSLVSVPVLIVFSKYWDSFGVVLSIISVELSVMLLMIIFFYKEVKID